MEEKIRVLIVDGSPVARDGLKSILGRYPDIEVVGEASTSEEALAEAGELRPDVVLMDAQLDVADGIETTRHLKERVPSAKVLVLTVHESYIQRALDAGADGCLMKDCSRQELVQKTRELGSHW